MMRGCGVIAAEAANRCTRYLTGITVGTGVVGSDSTRRVGVLTRPCARIRPESLNAATVIYGGSRKLQRHQRHRSVEYRRHFTTLPQCRWHLCGDVYRRTPADSATDGTLRRGR